MSINVKDILICKPNKGNAVVTLNKNEYIDQMNSLLSDNTKFTFVDDDIFIDIVSC